MFQQNKERLSVNSRQELVSSQMLDEHSLAATYQSGSHNDYCDNAWPHLVEETFACCKRKLT